MLSTVFVPATIILLICYLSTWLGKRKHLKIPVLTPSWPLIGNAWQIDVSNCHQVFVGIAKKLGPIFEIKLYGDKAVVLNDYETIRSALVSNGNQVAGRPQMYRTTQAQRNRNSIVWQTFNQKLILLRKEVLKSLRMYGNGLDDLEEKCIPEIVCLLQEVESKNSKPFDPWPMLYDSICNVMLILLLGSRLDTDSEHFKTIKTIAGMFNETFGSGDGQRLDIIPWLKLFKTKDSNRLETALCMRDTFWKEQLIQNMVTDDSVVGQLYQLSKTDTGKKHDITEDTIKECFTNLILAGTDTTATAITCLLLVFLHYPEVQDRMYKEISAVLQTRDLPRLSDRSHTPYTEAVLLELLRYISHVPLAVPHCTISDTNIAGFLVPKDTTIYINLWALHHDETFWENPWKFSPGRFLDNEGKLVPPQHPSRKRLMPFGAGRRVCLGETLAKNRLYLYVLALVKRYEFKPSDIEEIPDMDPRSYSMGLVLHPKPFNVKAIPRSCVNL